MTKPTLALLFLATLTSCDAKERKPTAVDVAIDCIEQMAWCKDWSPVPVADEYRKSMRMECDEECESWETECKSRHAECLRFNRDLMGPKYMSPCQQKLALCVDLVDRSREPKEVHYHH